MLKISISDFLAKLRLYLQNQDVDPANNAEGLPIGKKVAIGYLRGCMKKRALEWFDEKITIKQNCFLANSSNGKCSPIFSAFSSHENGRASKNFLLSAPQTVEPIRQSRGSPSSLKIEKDLKNYYIAEYLKEVGLLNKEDLDSNYPIKLFQRSCPQRNNNSARFDRIEKEFKEIQNNVNHEFGGINDPAIKYIDVPVILKNKEDKTVTVIGNFVHIDNSETEPMLFFAGRDTSDTTSRVCFVLSVWEFLFKAG
ncbi:hypothetical protein C1645_817278 [Glomus cerebriforme]|uniref:Uncharacterized protein n=1 Tax=Glomus cerebriforme TaxID=658196 RepID=A0A397TJI2_9GLOM|nr:hypothetical protein C1645_817278 [Glomus cerebriforme]